MKPLNETNFVNLLKLSVTLWIFYVYQITVTYNPMLLENYPKYI